jgi:hypothetical protein
MNVMTNPADMAAFRGTLTEAEKAVIAKMTAEVEQHVEHVLLTEGASLRLSGSRSGAIASAVRLLFFEHVHDALAQQREPDPGRAW